MITQNEVEQIIELINNGMDMELISFELDIPMKQLNKYKEKLELRKYVKNSIVNGKAEKAIEKLEFFIENSDENIVERAMLTKLRGYLYKIDISQEMKKIEKERKDIGIFYSIDQILETLDVQISKRKNKILKLKKQKNEEEDDIQERISVISQEKEEKDYTEIIEKYKREILSNPKSALNKRNLLAFTYFKAGQFEESRQELKTLIDEFNNFTAYQQIIHLEKNQGNYEDAKLWAYDCLEYFPKSIEVRQRLISIAKEEHDDIEIVKQLKEIININPEDEKSKEMLKKVKGKVER